MNGDRPGKASILIVDDTIDNLRLMTSMLSQQGYEARPVPNGRLALQAVEHDPPDLILLDINMPAMNGYEVCERLKAQASTRDIPVIFVSALDETMDKVKAFGVGGSDYVTKPLQYEEVFARVECQLALRRAHLELETSYRNLRELEQLRDNLVHMIVHDMRSPLGVLLAHGFFLKQNLGTRISPEHAQDIDALLEAGERLESMASNVLDVSRLESARMPVEATSCDLDELVQTVVGSLQALQPERSIVVDTRGSVATRCDRVLIMRVIENLIGNGLKHTPAGRPLHVSILEERASVRVSVQDEGPGIPADFQDKVFEKFGALAVPRQHFHSVGLGLAMCKLTLAAHGGAIGVESQEGHGSRFWFTLPKVS
jgi:two-component system sensor histidine kinase/response regulator